MRRVYGRECQHAYPRRSRWNEPERKDRSNPCSDVWLNGEKSAEVVVADRRRTEQQQILELMKGRDMCGKQKIPKGSCPGRARLEAEEEPEARSMSRRAMREKNGGDLLKSIVSRENMVRAYKQVRKNGGAPGVDGMTVDGLKTYLGEHYESLICSILDGTY